MGQTDEFDALEEERAKRSFPTSSEVYHFHPIAFVEQMKLILVKEDIDLNPLMTFEAQTGKTGKQENQIVISLVNEL